MNNQLEELWAYNKALEESPEYQSILPEVMKEVYTIIVNERIEDLERLAETEDDGYLFDDDGEFLDDDLPWIPTSIERKMNKPSFLIATAKSFMPDNPQMAVSFLPQRGCCHRIWSMQKTILKEKYGITWYTPAELNPDIIFD